jgi:hypothetical protein
MLMTFDDVHPGAAANDDRLPRTRTTPIQDSIHPVPGYPSKLVVFKIAASRFWQVRCWIAGRTVRRSTKTVSLRQAQNFARRFYESLLAERYREVLSTRKAVGYETGAEAAAPRGPVVPTVSDMALELLGNEKARVDRGEFSFGSWQVMRNRLRVAILPRWGHWPVSAIDYRALLDFSHELSEKHSSTTLSQYMVVVRKLLTHALHMGVLTQLPEFPKVKIVSSPRSAFTPTEYRRIVRRARALRGRQHPQSLETLRKSHKLRQSDAVMPHDLAWAMGFMVNAFIRPSDLKTLKHRHVEIVHGRGNTYLRLTLPETKKHSAPIVTLWPAVWIYQQICKHHGAAGRAGPDDYLFMPHLKDRDHALKVLGVHFNWVLADTGLKMSAFETPRTLYSLRHSAITFRLLYGSGIDLLTLARNARTSVEVINEHYASTLTAEQNIGMLQSRRSG